MFEPNLGRVSQPSRTIFASPFLQGDALTMPPIPAANKVDSPAHELAVILRTTLSLLDSYASRDRESSSLRDLERALICAISDLKRVEEREHVMPGRLSY